MLPGLVPNHALRSVIEDALRRDPELVHCFSNLAVPTHGVIECEHAIDTMGTLTCMATFMAEVIPEGHELYDHTTDPGEHQNIADRPDSKPIVDRLGALIPETVAPPVEDVTRKCRS